MSRVLVIHAGALGDHVLIWPLLRALGCVYGPASVLLACEVSKGRLASSELGVSWTSHEQPVLRSLWRDDGPGPLEHELAQRHLADVSLVISFVAPGDSPVESSWRSHAARLLNCEIIGIGPPGSPSRRAAWDRFRVHELGQLKAISRATDPGMILAHVGAGGTGKRWPIARFGKLSRLLEPHELSLKYLAGEVERERLSPGERSWFTRRSGLFIDDLGHLADILRLARVYVGGDTGPTHLAAQLGVPTIAMFGPTDPAVWSPVGPRVRVLCPPAPTAMDWLEAAPVASAILEEVRSPS